MARRWPPRGGHVADRLLDRLADNERSPIDICKLLQAAVAGNRLISPGGKWLLDNFDLIEERIRTAERHLPKGYSRELPLLTQGGHPGYPQFYDSSPDPVAHGDGRIDTETLGRFLAAYQTVTALLMAPADPSDEPAGREAACLGGRALREVPFRAGVFSARLSAVAPIAMAADSARLTPCMKCRWPRACYS